MKPVFPAHSSKIFLLCQIQEDMNLVPFVSATAQAKQLSATNVNTIG